MIDTADLLEQAALSINSVKDKSQIKAALLDAAIVIRDLAARGRRG